MARKLTLKQARQAAWRGQTDVAISVLQPFAEAGDAAASASLAELLAFRGRWEEVIVHAGRLIANPGAVYAGNVFNDMIGLLGRAGHETDLWQQIKEAATSAAENIDKIEKRDHARKRLFTILKVLEEYSLRSGAPPNELLRVFGVRFDFPQADLDASHQKAVYEATHNNARFRQNPAELSAYIFAVTINCHQSEETIKIYESGNMPANFDCAVHVARLFVDRGDLERSWHVLWEHMSRWWPVDKAQVAPVILLNRPSIEVTDDPREKRTGTVSATRP